MRLEEGKNWVEKTSSFVYAQRRAHTHMQTHTRAHRAPINTAFLSQHFSLSSLVVFTFAKLPVFPNLTPLFLAFKFLLQLMRTGKEGGMFIAGRQLGNSE